MIKRISAVLLFSNVYFFSGSYVYAQDAVRVTPLDGVTVQEATMRVNVAGRQRMLSQRMAKAACLISNDVSADAYQVELGQAYALFSKSDVALRDGDDTLGLRVERARPVLDALSAIDIPWRVYRDVIDPVREGQILTADALLDMDVRAVDLLFHMNAAVNRTARVYGSIGPDVPLALTLTVDVAGRQRMLTQRAVKEACLMMQSDDPQALASRLANTVRIFDASLTALQFGMAEVGVIAPPTEELALTLSEVQTLWTPVKSLLDRAAAGEVLSHGDLTQLAQQTEPLLVKMNHAVGLY